MGKLSISTWSLNGLFMDLRRKPHVGDLINNTQASAKERMMGEVLIEV